MAERRIVGRLEAGSIPVIMIHSMENPLHREIHVGPLEAGSIPVSGIRSIESVPCPP